MSSCQIRLLGAFSVSVDGHAVRDWRHRRAAELVKLLALADHHRLHREQLMDALWPDLKPEAAAANLRKAVHFARRALGSEPSIRTMGELVELWPRGDLWIDVSAFESAARPALASRDPHDLTKAAELWTGELLPEDRYAAWADEARERLRMRALQVLKACRSWERVLEADPTDEEAHRALMQRALDAGDRAAAIRQFERLRQRLRTDLGVGPNPASVALYEKALTAGGREPASAAERTRALLAWGLVHLNSGDLDEAERTAEEARSFAIDSNLGREIGEASALLGIVANMKGRWRELFRSEFVSAVRRSPEIASFVFDAHLCLAEFSLCGPAPYDEIVTYAHELLTVAERAESLQGRGLAELLLGEADLFSDRLDDARAHLTAAAQLHHDAHALAGEALATQRLAETAIARGQLWHAKRLLGRGLRLAEKSPLTPHLLVRMHGALVEADEESALERIEDADTALAGGSVCPPCSMGFRLAAAAAFARAGRLQESRRRLADAERLAGLWPGGPWHAAVWEGRGVLRRAEGNNDQAAALFKEAADLFAGFGRRRDEARCREAAFLAATDRPTRSSGS